MRATDGIFQSLILRAGGKGWPVPASVVGSIFFVDLRLLGFLGKGNPVRQASRILPFTLKATFDIADAAAMAWPGAA